MNFNKKGYLIIFLILCFMIYALIPSCAIAKEDFKIGYIMPLSGTVAQWGEANKRGAELAVEEINKSGGVLGYELKLLIEDGEGKPTVTVNAAEKFISRDSVDILVGPVMSSCTMAELDVINRHKVPLVVSTSTAPQITAPDSPTKGYVFRLVPTNDIMGAQLTKYVIENLGLKKIAITTDVANEWSITFRDIFINEMKKYPNAELVANESIKGGDTDFYAVLTKIKSKSPDGLFVMMQINEAANFVKQADELNIEAQLFSAQGCSDPAFIKVAGKSANGLIALSMYEPTNIVNDVSRRFTENFYKKYENLNIDPGLYDAQAYDAIYFIADALKRAGTKEKDKLLGALRNTSNLQGVIGITTLDENGQAFKDVLLVKIADGKKEVVE